MTVHHIHFHLLYSTTLKTNAQLVSESRPSCFILLASNHHFHPHLFHFLSQLSTPLTLTIALTLFFIFSLHHLFSFLHQSHPHLCMYHHSYQHSPYPCYSTLTPTFTFFLLFSPLFHFYPHHFFTITLTTF